MADTFRITATADLNEAKTKAQFEKSLKSIEKNLNIDVSTLKNVKSTLEKTGNEVTKVTKSTSTFKDAMGNVSKVTTDANGNILRVNKTTKELKSNMDSAKKSTMSFTDQMVEGGKKMLIWGTVGTLIYGSKRALEDAVQAVKELDDALLELRKVTDLTDTQLEGFVGTANDLGKTLNATATEVTQVTSDFARMGFSVSESLDLAEQALVLTKIGDGIKDVSDSSTALISILKGFNLEASESARIVNVLNEVSNNFAVSTSDIVQGMTRVSAVLAQSGTTLEESVGLFTSVFEVLQSSERSASGLVTISSRLQRIKEDVEDVDGLTTNLGKAFKEYAGIDLQKPNGEIKSTYEIITETAKVWDTLSQEAQGYIAFLASGTRQSKTWNSLMSNSNTIIDATASGMNSAGSATEEFNKYLDSMQGKLDEMSATWNRIALDFISSDFVNIMLDFANATSKAVEVWGPFETALLAVAGIMGYKGVFGFALKGAVSAFAQYTFAATASTTATIALSSAMATLVPVAIVAGIIGIVKAVDHFTVSTKELYEEIETTKQKINELQSEVADLSDKLKNTELSTEELALLQKELDIKQQLLKVEKERVANDLRDLLPDDEFYKDRAEGLSNFGIKRTGLTISDDPEKSQNLVKDIELINKAIEDYEEIQRNANAETKAGRKQYQKASETLSDLREKQANYNQEALDYYNDAKNNEFAWNDEKIRKYAEELYVAIGMQEEVNKVTAQAEANNSSLEVATYSLSDALSDLVSSGEVSSDMMKKLIKDQEFVDLALNGTKQEIIDYAYKWGLSVDEITDLMSEGTDAIISDLQRQIQAMETAMQGVIDYRNQVQSAMAPLRAPEFGEGIDNPFGFNLQEVDTGFNAIISSTQDKLDALRSNIVDNRDRVKEIGDMFKSSSSSATSSTKKATEAVREYSNELKRLNELQYEYDMLVNQGASEDDRISKIKEIQAELQRVNDARRAELELMKANLSTLESQLSTQKEGTEAWTLTWNAIQSSKKEIDGLDSTIKSTSKEWWTWRDALKSINEEIEEAKENQLELFKDTVEEGIQSDIDALERERDAQKDLYKDKIDAIDDTIDSLKEEREIQEAIEKIQEKQIELLKAQNVLEDVKKERNTKVLIDGEWQWIANPSDVQKAQEDVDKITDSLQDMQEQKAFDDRIRELEKDKEFYEDKQDIIEDAYNSEIDVLQNALDTFKDIEADNYADRLQAVNDFVDEYMNTLSELNYINSSTTSVSRSSGSSSRSSSTSKSFGTQSSAESKAYYDSLKESTGGNKELMDKAEIARTEAVITSRKASGQSTSDQETWLKKLKAGTAQYEFGGDKKGDGLAYLHNKEGVLTPDMNYAFKSLVSSVTGTKMPNIPLTSMNQNINSGKSYTINGGLKIVAPNGANLKNLLDQATMMADFS